MKRYVIALIASYLNFSACTSTEVVSSEEYCAIRAQQLSQDTCATQTLSLIRGSGEQRARMESKTRFSEAALMYKHCLQASGISVAPVIALELTFREFGHKPALPQAPEVAQCLSDADTVDEADQCMSVFDFWVAANPDSPAPCPLK